MYHRDRRQDYAPSARRAFVISTRSVTSVPWTSGKARVCKTLIPRFKSGRHLQSERDFAEHAGTKRAGDRRDVARGAKQRLVGEDCEGDRLLGLGIDAEGGGALHRDRRQQLDQVAHQRRVQRASTRYVDLVGQRRQDLAVAARDGLGGEAGQRGEEIVLAAFVAGEQRIDEVFAEVLAAGGLRQR